MSDELRENLKKLLGSQWLRWRQDNPTTTYSLEDYTKNILYDMTVFNKWQQQYEELLVSKVPLNKHRCKKDHNEYGESYGVAINFVYEDQNDCLWAGNGEYLSPVDYCPFCGYKAINGIEKCIEMNK